MKKVAMIALMVAAIIGGGRVGGYAQQGPNRGPAMGCTRPGGGSALGDIKKAEQEKHKEWDKVSPEPKNTPSPKPKENSKN